VGKFVGIAVAAVLGCTALAGIAIVLHKFGFAAAYAAAKSACQTALAYLCCQGRKQDAQGASTAEKPADGATTIAVNATPAGSWS